MTKDISEMQPDELAKHIQEAQKILQKKKDDELAKLATDISTAIEKSNFSLEEVVRRQIIWDIRVGFVLEALAHS